MLRLIMSIPHTTIDKRERILPSPLHFTQSTNERTFVCCFDRNYPGVMESYLHGEQFAVGIGTDILIKGLVSYFFSGWVDKCNRLFAQNLGKYTPHLFARYICTYKHIIMLRKRSKRQTICMGTTSPTLSCLKDSPEILRNYLFLG